MSIGPLRNAKCYLDAWDISGDLNAVALEAARDMQDATTLGAGARKNFPGFLDAKVSLAGLWQAGADLVDETLWNKLALVNTLVTVAPETGAEGEIAYLLRLVEAAYAPLASVGVGQLAKFSMTGQGTDGLIRATVLVNGTKNANGNGTAFNLGLVASGQTLYAGLHVLAVSGGGTWTFTVQSDEASGFASPITRITFGAVTAKGSEWATPVAGPIATDFWWRAGWSVTGGVGNAITFLVTAGIQ